MELEPSSGTAAAPPDPRPRMPEPPPVRLLAIDDVRLLTPSGVERDLDAFYVLLLGFEREDISLKPPTPTIWSGSKDVAPKLSPPLAEIPPGPVYRSENFRLRFQVLEPPITQESLRPQGIEVRSLAETQIRLTEMEIQYVYQRSLTPGQESLLLQDPAGNWIELVESRATG